MRRIIGRMGSLDVNDESEYLERLCIVMPKGITVIPMIILGIIFLQGLLNAINPKILWRTFESWKATKEPTSSYFLSRRIFGIVSMLIVIGLFIFPYLMNK